MDPCLAKYLLQTIQVAKATGYSSGGSITFGTPVSHPAHIEREDDRQGTASGTEIATSHRIITEAVISLDDRVFLEGDDLTSGGRRPVSIERIPDIRTGQTSHYEVEI